MPATLDDGNGDDDDNDRGGSMLLRAEPHQC